MHYFLSAPLLSRSLVAYLAMAKGYRIEKDTMGEMKIPSNAFYGASTQRAVENFPVSGLRFPKEFIRALALLKEACAAVNLKLKKLDPKTADCIILASREIASGKFDTHFVVDVFQTGSGTSTNMNFNEVAANLCQILGMNSRREKIHPNDHINLGQSSNDVIPSAIHIAVVMLVEDKLLPALTGLQSSLKRKSLAFSKIVKTGRTHLQDATPITLGQEFSGYQMQVQKSIERVRGTLPRLYELAIGGTAVGTGINTHKHFGKFVCEKLRKKTGKPFKEAENHFEAQAAKDACVELSSTLKTVAVSLTKIANDIRWLASGPRCGIGELTLPATQPGSSIMPGKVNPVIAESLLQVCAQVMGNDLAVTLGGQSGAFELNVMMPLIAHNLIQSLEILSNAVRLFDQKCVQGIQANQERIRETIDLSLMLATPLAKEIGYEKAAAIAKKAFEQNLTIKELAEKELKIDRTTLKKLLDPTKMV